MIMSEKLTDDPDTKSSKRGSKYHPCSECSKVFSRSDLLKKHLLIHTGEKPHECSTCGRRFQQKSGLVLHQRSVHDGLKPYSCDMCGQRFARKGEYIRHERRHTGEMSQQCSFCGRTFRDKWSLLEHEKIHRGDKPHQCRHCRKLFRHKKTMHNHERIHTGEKPFTCIICQKTFRQDGTYRRHLDKHGLTGVKMKKKQVTEYKNPVLPASREEGVMTQDGVTTDVPTSADETDGFEQLPEPSGPTISISSNPSPVTTSVMEVETVTQPGIDVLALTPMMTQHSSLELL